MDPRQRRTYGRLREAVFQLAAQHPLAEVSVSDVARCAGISRNTFYRWASSPEALLAAMLDEELDAIVEAHRGLPRTSGGPESVFEGLARAIVEFTARHAEIYRNAMTPRLNARLRDVLGHRIERSLIERLETYPDIAPDVLGARPSHLSERMLVAYAAAGAVGAIEEWIRAGDLTTIDVAVDTIEKASAPWWLGQEPDRALPAKPET